MFRVNSELAEARQAALLTQAELARRLGVSARTVQNWESGAVEPQARHRRLIAAFISQQERKAAA